MAPHENVFITIHHKKMGPFNHTNIARIAPCRNMAKGLPARPGGGRIFGPCPYSAASNSGTSSKIISLCAAASSARPDE
jgi:hypothetical protein